MLIFNLFSNPLAFVIFLVAIIIALTIHEFSHAYVATQLGDPTPKSMGRLSLNPLAHLDPLGTLFLFIAGFGWGKPVIINPRNFKNPKLDNLTVSLAGPISNFFLALILGLIYRFVPLGGIVQSILTILIFFNLTLMIFNLLPIPPLDGSKILGLFIPEETFNLLQQISIPLLFVLIIFSSFFFSGFSTFLLKIITFFFHIITGSSPII